jgi:5'(3')-deoxyribonucleotidase
LRILLDLDGVLSEWVKGAADMLGLSYDDLMRTWPRGEYTIAPTLRISEDELWRRVHAIGEDFWAGLPETPWARRLYEGARKLGPVFFLTSPSNHPSSLAGKLTWMQKFTGNPRFKDFLVGPRKELCASAGSVLVDDSDDNLAKFSVAGGRAICFPRVWNRMHNYEGDPCDYVLSRLASIASVPADDDVGRALAVAEAAGDAVKAGLASLYGSSRDELNEIIRDSRDVGEEDMVKFLAGIGASIAKEEFLKRLAGERMIGR